MLLVCVVTSSYKLSSWFQGRRQEQRELGSGPCYTSYCAQKLPQGASTLSVAPLELVRHQQAAIFSQER